MMVYLRKMEIVYSKPVIFQLWAPKKCCVPYLNTVATSWHRTKDNNTCVSFCNGSISNANCIILKPVALDCLMKWAEVSVRELPMRLAQVSFNMEVEMIFFRSDTIWEWFKSKSNFLCNGSRLSIRSSSRALFHSFLNFPSLYWWWMGAQGGNNCRL